MAIKDPLKQAYQTRMTGEDVTDPDDELKRAYRAYLTTPTDTSSIPVPENIIPQTVSNVKEQYKKGGLLPSIASGLSGIVSLANTSAGHNIISQMKGGDMSSKEAWLGGALKQKEREEAMKASAGAREGERTGRVADYGLENLKVENQQKMAQRKEFLDNREDLAKMAESGGDTEAAAKILAMEDPSELSTIQWKNPDMGDRIIAGIGKIFGMNTGKGGNVKVPTAVGAIKSGYRFKGGDATKQENWESIK